ncbi:MAG: ClpX C4-type zinc finger protein [Acidimicrobiales bacterium]
MVLDPDQLARVFDSRSAFERIEDDLWEARGAYHREIRTLHAGGGSFREIADALGMSHQRVHQIVGEDAVVEVESKESTAVVRFTEDQGEEAAASACSFCGAPRTEVDRMLAAPGQRFICGECVERAVGIVSGATEAGAPLQASSEACSFCGRQGNSAAASVDGSVVICDRCVASSQRIVAPEPGESSGGRRREIAMRCSFCNANQREVAKLIAGPGVYVCGECVAAASSVASSGEAMTGPRQVSMLIDGRPCGFCSKRAAEVKAVVRGGRGHICNECLDLCSQIITEDENS